MLSNDINIIIENNVHYGHHIVDKDIEKQAALRYPYHFGKNHATKCILSKYYVLYNPKSNNGADEAEIKTLDTMLKGEDLVYADVLSVDVKLTDIVDIRKGHEVTVEFDKPTALQIDGETIKNVKQYTVKI